jgi:succinyl-CoA synthetase beta subunit
MDLPEYESKELIAQFGVIIPDGHIAKTPEAAEEMARAIKSQRYMVKAQITAGGRGLAGGIKVAATPSAVREEAKRMIGANLVTEQTGATGQIIRSVYVEAAVDIASSYFVALAIDPDTALPMLFASTRGGVEFEQAARMDPDVVRRLALTGNLKADVREFLTEMDIPDPEGAADVIRSLHRAFLENDMTLLEINPFARTKSGEWVAVDAKVSFDDNAKFRHPELEAIAADPYLSPAEKVAQENNINLVKLDGSIGVVVNGAGLGLATNDMLIDAGGKPANFMDIRTTANSFDIAKGVELLLEDSKVKTLLVNVHGGGMTVCDTIAEGVAFAYSRTKRRIPIVVRFAGTNAEWGLKILKDRHLPVESCKDMTHAVRRSVDLSRGAA